MWTAVLRTAANLSDPSLQSAVEACLKDCKEHDALLTDIGDADCSDRRGFPSGQALQQLVQKSGEQKC